MKHWGWLGLMIGVVNCSGGESEPPSPVDCYHVDWNAKTCAEVAENALMAMSLALSAFTGDMRDDVRAACQSIAVDLGAPPDSVNAVDLDDQTAAWCSLAVTWIQSEITAKGSVSISFSPPRCAVDVPTQVQCEMSQGQPTACQAELSDVVARCDPLKLSGACSGDCLGSCDGARGMPIACSGKCEGACSGTCEGTAIDNGACFGVCEGLCEGSCTPQAGASLSCDGFCTGGCSVAYSQPFCTDSLLPPSAACQGCAEDCGDSCSVLGPAGATCSEPAVAIAGTGPIHPAAVSTLAQNLPVLLSVSEARGSLVNDAAFGVLCPMSVQGEPSNRLELCAVEIAEQFATSFSALDTSISASASIKGALGL